MNKAEILIALGAMLHGFLWGLIFGHRGGYRRGVADGIHHAMKGSIMTAQAVVTFLRGDKADVDKLFRDIGMVPVKEKPDA